MYRIQNIRRVFVYTQYTFPKTISCEHRKQFSAGDGDIFNALAAVGGKVVHNEKISAYFKKRFTAKMLKKSIEKRGLAVDISDFFKRWEELQKLTGEHLEIKSKNSGDKSDQSLDLKFQINKLVQEALTLPNVIERDTPLDENVVIYTNGSVPSFAFSPKPHSELCKDIIFKDSGPLSYYMIGLPALIELSLSSLCLRTFQDLGFIVQNTPDLIKPTIAVGCGLNYKDTCSTIILDPEQHDSDPVLVPRLVGGASLSSMVTSFLKMKVLKPNSLPLKFVSNGRNYQPAVLKNKPTLFNTMQTSQVQFMILVNENINENTIKETLDLIKIIFAKLHLYFRVVSVCAKNLSKVESSRLQVELWSPNLEQHIPVAYLSTYNDFISRRLHILYAEGKEDKYAHIIHGSAMDITKTIGCIIEYFQTNDGDVNIPEILADVNL